MAKEKELSVDMYHRIYRMAVRKTPADQIAITLDLPINVVRNVVEQFFPTVKNTVPDKKAPSQKKKTHHSNESYLDIYILQRLRFSVVDINGMVTEEHNDRLHAELQKVLSSNLKLVALLMTNVKAIDEKGFSTILSFYNGFLAKGRYSAILDPSQITETFIEKNGHEADIQIFGTEKAFEENALKTKKKK